MKTAKTLALAWALLTLATSGSRAHVINNNRASSNISRSKGNFGPELIHRSYVVPNSIHTTKPSIDALTSPNEELSAQEIAIKFVKENLHPYADFVIKNIYKSDHNGITHVYFKQIVNGLEVVNSDLNVNIDIFGRVISYGDSFIVPSSSPGPAKCSGFKEKYQPEEETVVI